MAGAGLLLALLSSCAFAAAAAPDTLRHRMIGAWIIAPGHFTPVELATRKQGLFASQQFNADGSGDLYSFWGKYCGPIYQIIPFHWKVAGNQLIEDFVEDGEPHATRETIISNDGTNLVGAGPAGEKPYDYEVRAPVCATS